MMTGWEGQLATLAGAALVGLLVSAALVTVGRFASRLVRATSGGTYTRRLAPPLLLLGPVLGVRLALPAVEGMQQSLQEAVDHGLALALIGLVGWAVIGALAVFDVILRRHFPVDQADNLGARRIRTRFALLRRVGVILTVMLCGIAAMMTFPGLRALGAGLLASAGLVGLVVGLAARPTVEALIAGVQIAWTQPIRIDDVVIVEGEWGRIEEIHATYVVIRLWDLRRLVIPTSYVLTQPFQNWTRTSADLLGAVTVEVDYCTPVDAVRKRVGEILAKSPRFLGGFWNLQVVEAGPQTMRLRVLMDAPNADLAWELRCEVREALILYLQTEHPDALPRLRAEVASRSTREPGSAPTA